MKTYVLIFIFFIEVLICFGQKNKFSIYVGKVEGLTKEKFNLIYDEYDMRRDSSLEYKPITESIFPIEIRLYENPSASGVGGCTTLYFDTSFKARRSVKSFWKGWTPKEQHNLNDINPDSAFRKMVENGIFDLPEYSDIGQVNILTEKGISKESKLSGGLDGTDYVVQTKVGDMFTRFVFSSHEENFLKSFPGETQTRRKKEIVNQLKANLSLIKL